jgi:hypothetical protein
MSTKISSYVTENKLCVHFKDQTVIAIKGIVLWLLLETCATYKNILWQNEQFCTVTEDGIELSFCFKWLMYNISCSCI